MNIQLASWGLLVVALLVSVISLAVLGFATLVRSGGRQKLLGFSMLLLPMFLIGLMFTMPRSGPIMPAPWVQAQRLKLGAPALDDGASSTEPSVVPDSVLTTGPVQPTEIKELVYETDGSVREKIHPEVLPAWASRKSSTFEDDEGVLISQRFSTLDEARAQLEQEARKLLKKRDIWMPLPFLEQRSALSLLQMNGGILRECRITWPVEVGAFTEPVYQVALQVRLTDGVSERLTAATFGLRKTRNLRWLGGGVVLVSIGLALSSFLCRKLAGPGTAPTPRPAADNSSNPVG